MSLIGVPASPAGKPTPSHFSPDTVPVPSDRRAHFTSPGDLDKVLGVVALLALSACLLVFLGLTLTRGPTGSLS